MVCISHQYVAKENPSKNTKILNPHFTPKGVRLMRESCSFSFWNVVVKNKKHKRT